MKASSTIPYPNSYPAILYLLTFFVAACSLIYELLIVQSISFFASNIVICYSLTIGLYLVAMGAGAFLYEKFFKHYSEWMFLGVTEIILGVLGGFVVVLIYFTQMLMSFCWVHRSFIDGTVLFWVVSLFCIVSVGILTGLELPVLIKIGEKYSAKNIMNRILSADYFGSLAGGLAFPILFYPYFDLMTIGFTVASLNLVMAILIFSFSSEKTRRVFSVLAWVFLIVFILGIIQSSALVQYFAKKFYYYEQPQNMKSLIFSDPQLPDIKRTVSPYQKIDLVKLPSDNLLDQLVSAYSTKLKENSDYPKELGLFMDGYFQFWSGFEELYHEYIAHIPINLMGAVPKKILILGAGDGLLLRELVKYKTVESITLVEIDPKIIELARNNSYFKEMNEGAFSDSRVQVVLGDAFQFVKHAKEQYDCVYMDFPDPKDYNLSKIYSREFYYFVKSMLTPDGFAVLDAPRQRKLSNDSGLDEDEDIYLQTLLSAGFTHVYRFHSRLEEDNPQARNIFAEHIGDANQLVVREMDSGVESTKTIVGKEAIVEKMLDDFVTDYQESFYFVTNNDVSLNKNFTDYGIKLYLLNEKRFRLVSSTMQNLVASDDQHVNSIMRPTLPQLSQWWNIKLPY